MTLENAKKFIERLAKNVEFKQEIENSMVNQFIQNAQKSGLTFSKDDFQQAWKEITNKKFQLSDEDLDKVAGGSVYDPDADPDPWYP